jgi:hypothetical protein
MGKLCTISDVNTLVGCTTDKAPSGAIDFTDGAFLDHGVQFTDASFPYVKTPLAGSPSN